MVMVEHPRVVGWLRSLGPTNAPQPLVQASDPTSTQKNIREAEKKASRKAAKEQKEAMATMGA